LWLHHVDAGVVVLSSRSGDVWGSRDGERARARNNDDVIEPGDPKTIEGAGGELDTASGKLDWGTVLGADIAREMGISASRTGDGSRPEKECNRVGPPSGGGVGRKEVLEGGVGVGDGDCEFGLRGEGVRGEEEGSREPLAGVLVLLGDEGRGAAIVVPAETGEDDERNG
jgi:hypothetical protein